MTISLRDRPSGPSQNKYDWLIALARQVPAARTVVVHPCDETSLRGAIEAAELGIINPILVGCSCKNRRGGDAAQDRHRSVRDRRHLA